MDASRLGAAVPYMVQLKKGKIVPCPIDDPDFIRARGASTRPARPRFKVGDSVECKTDPTIGSPARFARSGSRTRAGAAAGGSSACSDTSEIRSKPRTAARTTSPRRKAIDGKVVGSANIMVPADNGGYIRTSANSRTKQPRTPSKRRTRRVAPDRAVNSSTRSSEPTRSLWRLTRPRRGAGRFHRAPREGRPARRRGPGELAGEEGAPSDTRVESRKLPRKGDARKARTVLLKLLIQECKNDAKYEQRFSDMLEEHETRHGGAVRHQRHLSARQ